MQKTPLTVKGLEKITAELEQLKTVDRPRVIAAISEARAHGDLKENAEYHAAKEQQSFLETRIQDLEGKLSSCQVIDVATIPNEGKVIFGATVTLVNIDDDKEVTYQIVGEDEADIKYSSISISSPLARAMIGKYEAEEIIVLTPEGEVAYEILEVKYI